MESKIEKLKPLNNDKLIDVVKNYRQYGYDEEIRNSAIEILESRGLDMESLKSRGDFENKSYDIAKSHYKSYEKTSKLAFAFYGLTLFMSVSGPLIAYRVESLQLICILLFWFSFIGYFITVIKSFVSQSKYYEIIGKKDGQLNFVLFFTVGMSLYIIMYFMYRKQMKKDINLIR